MTRQIHDQFAKEYLEELLTTIGTAQKSKKVKSEVQEIDLFFEPFSPLAIPGGDSEVVMVDKIPNCSNLILHFFRER